MSIREYTKEYKEEAVKLAKEIGKKRAANELGVPEGTLYGWLVKEKSGEIDLGTGTRSPDNIMTLAIELKQAREKIKENEKEIANLKKINEFLDNASRFFAASRQK